MLPRHLWGEAVKAARDILNLRSTKRHPDKAPNELFSGNKPSIAHLRIFGSPVFVHISKTARTKLEPRSEKCILLSFDENAKAYRCFRPSTKRIFVSRDVFIDEDSLFNLPKTLDNPSPSPDDFISATNHTNNLTLPTPPKTTHPSSHTQTFQTSSEPTSPALDSDNLQNNLTTQPNLDGVVPSHSTPTAKNGSSDIECSRVISPTQPTPAIANNPLRRSDRIRHFPRHLQDFATNVELELPDSSPDPQTELTFQQVHTHPLWQAAMQEEMHSILSNNTWTLVTLPHHKRAISSRWVFKIRTCNNENPPRYKSRLVACGFEQKDGSDFLDTFAPVVRWETIRILIAIATHLGWPLHQLDVLTAFLNGILTEEVYMQHNHLVLSDEEHNT